MKLSKLLLTLAGLAGLAVSAGAAILVGPAGITNDFSTRPAATEWSTVSIGGSSGGTGDSTTASQVDTNVAVLLASSITTQLAASNANPPSAVGLAVWCTNGYVQTRPTGVRITILMATLVNNTGVDATNVFIGYDFAKVAVTNEQVEGHRVYYSLTGTANSWVNIPALSSAAPGAPKATVDLAWTNGATLYLLWADDNGSPSPDTACQIDNFTAAANVSESALAVTLNSPANGAGFVVGSSITIAATASSATNVGLYVDNSLLTNFTVAPYSTGVSNLAAGSHSIYAVASGSAGQVFSVTNTITVTNQPIAITTQPADAIGVVNASVSFTVVASGTTPAYQWYFNTLPITGANGATYTIASVQTSNAGTYRVVVTNSVNSVTSSNVSLVVTQANGWVAFNDQAPPPAKVTTYSLVGGAASSGPLTNSAYGNRLGVTMTITNYPATNVISAGTMAAPLTNTPAYTIFNGHINWTGANAGMHLYSTGVVAYTFSGLDPSKTYKLATTGVRGGDPSGTSSGAYYSNRWTQAELLGAASYVPAHSSGVLTPTLFPAFLSGSQVALNTGVNTTNNVGTPTGDVIEWDNIVPTVDGSITVMTKEYTGGIPGSPTGIATALIPAYTYALGQFRLEESAASTPTSPTLAIVNNGNGTVTISWPESSVTWQPISAPDTSSARSTWLPVADALSIVTNSSRVYLTVPANSPAHRFFDVRNP